MDIFSLLSKTWLLVAGFTFELNICFCHFQVHELDLTITEHRFVLTIKKTKRVSSGPNHCSLEARLFRHRPCFDDLHARVSAFSIRVRKSQNVLLFVCFSNVDFGFLFASYKTLYNSYRDHRPNLFTIFGYNQAWRLLPELDHSIHGNIYPKWLKLLETTHYIIMNTVVISKYLGIISCSYFITFYQNV